LRYDGRWRDRDPASAPEGIPPVIRFKAPQQGDTVVSDVVQGEVRVANQEMDDMVLLRADGTPTYMLAVVVDDFDMGVTHVIRGQDHFTNTFRQSNLVRALGWNVPIYAHVPLIHGPDGAKLSKRHGALGVETYRAMGYLPEALRNYLLRLGWSHGDEEIISTEQAIAWFNLEAIGQSPARFDFAKLASLNGHYIRELGDAALAELTATRLAKRIGRPIGSEELARIRTAMPDLKLRAKTLEELADGATYFTSGVPPLEAAAEKILTLDAKRLLASAIAPLRAVSSWTAPMLEAAIRTCAEADGIKIGAIAQPLRAALTGRTATPGVFEVMAALGRDEVLARLAERSRSG
jgi:glutamyl-tRNA synthetase